jgi:hypothetical protein
MGMCGARAGHVSPMSFTVSLDREFTLRLDVVDVQARPVACVTRGVRPAKELNAVWDGRDLSVAPVPPGLYRAPMRSGTATVTRRILMLR